MNLPPTSCNPIAFAQFTLSWVPTFVGKPRDVVGLSNDPPARAVVLSADERAKSRSLTAPNTQPGWPIKRAAPERCPRTDLPVRGHGRPRRNVMRRNPQRHRHQEFIRFLNTPAREAPASKTIHDSWTIMLPTNAPSCGGWRGCRADLPPRPRSRHLGSMPPAVSSPPCQLPPRTLRVPIRDRISGSDQCFLEAHYLYSKPFERVAAPDEIIATRKRGRKALASIP
jgi:hypothetical protein